MAEINLPFLILATWKSWNVSNLSFNVVVIFLFCAGSHRLPYFILLLLWQRERGHGWNHKLKGDLHTLVSRKANHSL